MSKDVFSIDENEMSDLLNIDGISDNSNELNLPIYQKCIENQILIFRDLIDKSIDLKKFDVNNFNDKYLKNYTDSNFLIIKCASSGYEDLFFLFKYKTAVQLINTMSGMKNIVIDNLGRETLTELFQRIFKVTIKTLYQIDIENLNITFHENETMNAIDKRNYPIIITNLKLIDGLPDFEEFSFIQFLPKEYIKKIGGTTKMDDNDLKKAVFSDFGGDSNNSNSSTENIEISDNEEKNINMVLDIPMELTVELGRTRKKIGEIIKFSEGSIIELDRIAGESIDIYVNGKNFARGEVVVINENFAVRITEIVDIKDRLKLYES